MTKLNSKGNGQIATTLLTVEQRDWLIECIKTKENVYTAGCITCNARIGMPTILDIINQCTEDEDAQT